MAYERLTAQDTVFLRIEDDDQPQHVGSLSIYDASAWRADDGRIDLDALRHHIGSRLHLVPRLRQRLMEVPLGQGRPVWIDDEAFDLTYHVRLTALPRPGTDDQLLETMSRIQSTRLDRARPLWELWFVDGLEADRAALIIKTHHALGDGIANVDLGLALLDAEPDVAPPEQPPPTWRPQPAPSSAELWAATAQEQLARPWRLAQAGVHAVRRPKRAFDKVANVGRTVWTMAGRPQKASWNREVTTHRRWRRANVSLAEIKHVKNAADVSLNDVVVAGCTEALRRFLADHEEPIEDRSLKAMVPVSVRTEDEHGDTLGNKISMFVVDLPVGEADPLQQLTDINEQTTRLKASGLVDGADTLIEWVDTLTPFAAPLTRLVSRSIPMNLVITNIPGPPMPLWFFGAPMLEVYPYVEVVDNEGLTIAVLSYCDQLAIGMTADRDVIPDLSDLARHLTDAFDDLAARWS